LPEAGRGVIVAPVTRRGVGLAGGGFVGTGVLVEVVPGRGVNVKVGVRVVVEVAVGVVVGVAVGVAVAVGVWVIVGVGDGATPATAVIGP
jgi:hypothetical protein